MNILKIPPKLREKKVGFFFGGVVITMTSTKRDKNRSL